MRNSVGSGFTKRLVFESLEPRLLLSADPLGAAEALAESGALVYEAAINGEASSYTLRFNAGSGDLELLDGNAVIASRALAQTSAVLITGEDLQDDSLTVDFGFGGFFAVEGGIRFDGGAGAIDLLSVTGGAFSNVTHTATGDGPGRSGTLLYDDGAQALAIAYANLEPIDMTGSTIANLVFNLPGLDDQAIIEDDGIAGNGVSQIRSRNASPTFETTLFSNTATSLTVNMGMDDGQLTVAALPDFANKALTIDGGPGADNVTFEGNAIFSSLNLFVGGSVAAASLQLGGTSFISAVAGLNAGTLNVAATSGTVTVNSALSAGTVSVGGGALLSLNEAASVGNLSVAGAATGANLGGLGGGGNVTLLAGGAHVWTSGLLSGAGTLRTEQGATLAISGGNHFLNGKGVVNDGRIVWTGGVIDVNNNGTLVNNGELELAANSTFGNVFAPNGTLTLTNNGVVRQSEAEATLFGGGLTFNNRGLVDVVAGTVSFGNGGTHTGRFNAAEGATVAFSGGTHNFTAASSVDVDGTLAVAAGTVNLTSRVDLSGALRVTGGVANITPASGEFRPTSIAVSGSGAVLNLAAAGTISPASVTISDAGTANLNSAVETGALSVTGGGTAGGVGGLSGTGAVTLLAGGAHTWNSGNLSGAGTLTVAAGATLTVRGGDHFLNSKAIANDGRVLWTGGVIDVNGANSFDNSGVLDMAAGNTLGNRFAPNGTLTLTNTGAIRQQAGTTTLTPDVTLVNQDTGTIEVADGATLRRLGGFTSAGTVSGGGTIDVGTGVLINTGTVAPDGTLTVLGNYSQGTAGHLEIGISSTEVDSLAVTGAASVADAATLRAAYDDGFTPGAGERFRIMSFASLNGFFGSTDLPQGAVIETSPTGLDLVAPANAAPQAADDSFATAEDTPLAVAAPGVLGNDSDPDQDTLSAILQTGPAHGTLTFNADGSFEYLPDTDFFGTDSFTYRVSDDVFESGIATVTLTVAAVNDAPVANPDVYGTDEDATLTIEGPGVLGNDTDVDSATLTATLVSSTAHGTLTLNEDGSFTYTPDLNYFGADSFTYRAGDGAAGSETTVTINVSAVNDAPVANPDVFGTDEDTTLTVEGPGVLGNDTDVDNATLTATLVSSTAHGALTFNEDGSFTYTPDLNYFGPDSFTYRAGDGAAGSETTVTINISAVNDAPVANPDVYGTQEDTTLTVEGPGVLGNDTDIDSATLTATLVSSTSHGVLTLNEDGSFTYTPDLNYFGADGFTYRAGDGADGSETTVTINVSAVNDAPVAHGDSFDVEAGGLTVTAPGVLGNDADADSAALTAQLVSSTANGTLTLNQDGSFTYTPNEGFSGTDSFTYVANDGSADSNVATVVLTVDGDENEAPSVDAGADQVVGLQDIDDDHHHWGHWWHRDPATAKVSINAVFADADLGDKHSATIDWGDGRVTKGKVIEGTDGADGAVQGKHTYTRSGTYTVTVTVRDADGNVHSDTLQVVVKKPIEKRNFDANADEYRLNEDSALTVNAAHGVLDNDRGPFGATIAARVLEGPEHGTLVFNADGSFTYTPDQDFHGQDSFWYEFTDGRNVSRAVEVELNVKDVREQPSSCVNWDDCWRSSWSHHFRPFGNWF